MQMWYGRMQLGRRWELLASELLWPQGRYLCMPQQGWGNFFSWGSLVSALLYCHCICSGLQEQSSFWSKEFPPPSSLVLNSLSSARFLQSRRVAWPALCLCPSTVVVQERIRGGGSTMSTDNSSKCLKECLPHLLEHESETHSLNSKNNKHLLDNKSQTMLSW